MKKKSLIAIILLGFITVNTYAQNVGINNTDPKAALDINGGLRTRVLTLPVTSAAVSIPANKSFVWLSGNPAAGFTINIDASYSEGSRLVVYNGTSKEAFIVGAESVFSGKITEMIFSDGEWRSIGTNNTTNQWNLNGNSGTDTGFNFIGTTDDQPLKFKVNNQPAGLIDANTRNTVLGTNAHAKLNDYSNASANVAIGANALSNDTSGNSNTAIGYYAMEGTKTAGGQNTAVGSYTLQNVQGNQNSAFGSAAMESFRTGNFNTALGTYAYTNKTSGTGNTAVGAQSMSPNFYSFNSGNYNTAVGMFSLKNNRIGNGSVAIGHQAAFSDTAAEGIVAIGRSALQQSNGKKGVLAIGDSALFSNGIGATGLFQATNNLAIGAKTLKSNTTGYDNIAIGKHSLINNTVGIGNIAMGTAALVNNVGNDYNIAIGDSSLFYAGITTIPEPVLVKGVNNNIVMGRNALHNASKSERNVAIGNNSNYDGVWADHNVSIGDSAMYANYHGDYNVAIGSKSMTNGRINWGTANVAVGYASLYNNDDNTSGPIDFRASGNVALGYFAGYNNTGLANNVFIGRAAGYNNKGSNKLYVESGGFLKDSTTSLIYGDFEADSLLLNAKTVVRNNAVIRGFTKLGGYGTDVPSIKTKKITGIGPAVNGNLAVVLGLDAAKIISVQIFMQYGAAPTPTKVLPPGYTLIAGYEYQFEIDGANILITNKGANSANIGNKPFRMFITYEE
jgi:trimeric autotransporter adhesin